MNHGIRRETANDRVHALHPMIWYAYFEIRNDHFRYCPSREYPPFPRHKISHSSILPFPLQLSDPKYKHSITLKRYP